MVDLSGPTLNDLFATLDDWSHVLDHVTHEPAPVEMPPIAPPAKRKVRKVTRPKPPSFDMT